jgi:CIC family chloride channel protein
MMTLEEPRITIDQSKIKGVFFQIKEIISHWYIPEEFTLIGTALVVGLSTGLGAVIFRYTIKGVEWFGYTWFRQLTQKWGLTYVILLPTVGGLLVGLLIFYFAHEAKGHGVPEVMEAIALKGGRIRPRVAIVKTIASGICIGSGGSVGREGPIVQIGSTLGSTIGQRLHLSDDRVRNLVACGAAAGIATTFNAPIAGVLFALEVILGSFGVRYFSSVVVASVAASVIGRSVWGSSPSFQVPLEYGINSLWEFAFYPILGILAGLLGVLYTRSIYWSEDRFDGWKGVPEWVKPAVGGLILGLVALAYPILTGVTWENMPQIYNVGYDVIEHALANQLGLKVVLVLMVLKLMATGLTLGSGGSGGIFAPSLFMGAMLGAAFEMVMKPLFPDLVAPPGAYALVGMAAVFSASAHAPITATIFLFELTGDYRIILPLMLTIVIATFLSYILLKGESIYTLKLTRRGVRLQSGRDVDVMMGVKVREVMTKDINTVSQNMPLSDLSELFSYKHLQSVMVLDDEKKLLGIATISDMDHAIGMGLGKNGTARDVATTGQYLVTAFPDESMGKVLSRMGARGLTRAPVVSQDDDRKLLGMIRREDIIRAYNLGLSRRQEVEQRTRVLQEQLEGDAEFLEITLRKGIWAVGKTVAQLAKVLPKECILVSIKGNGHSRIPHGDTLLGAGDRITVYVQVAMIEKLFASIRSGE